MKVAFTGTRKGMTDAQHERVVAELRAVGEPFQFHHGGAQGADTQAHFTALALGCQDIHVWVPARRSWPVSEYEPYVTVHETRITPLARNRLIIGHADLVLATPFQPREIRRAGTWATVRYARKAGLRIIVIDPNGEDIP